MVTKKPFSATDLRVPFGLRNSYMWRPWQVHSGLACNCVCPACGVQLLARNRGLKRRPHFSHLGGGTCKGAFETAVHMMAKQLICDRRVLLLPEWDGAPDMPNPPSARDARGDLIVGPRVELPAKRVALLSVTPELSMGDYRPDVAARDEDGEILIEVRVSHSVEDIKARNVRSEGRRMIEIDLSDVTPDQAADGALFEELVLFSPRNRIWISCPAAVDAWHRSRDDLRRALSSRSRAIDAAQGDHPKQPAELQRHTQQGAAKKAARREDLRQPHLADLAALPKITTAQAISSKYASLLSRDEREAEQLLSRVPEVLRPTLRSSRGSCWVYDAHYLLWQPAAYLHFVQGKPPGSPLSKTEIGKWVRATFGVEQVAWRLFRAQWAAFVEARNRGYKKHAVSAWFFTPEENKQIPDFYAPINGLVSGLLRSGVIEDDPKNGLVVASGDQAMKDTLGVPCSPPIHAQASAEKEDPFLGRRISHRAWGVGEVREKLSALGPTYNVWFNGQRWRKIWLGDSSDGSWDLLEDLNPPR